MIQVFKFLSDGESLGSCSYLGVVSSSRTRGHDRKLAKGFSRLDVRKLSFSQRVVNEWNSLPAWVVGSGLVLAFKNNIDMHFTNSYRI